MTDTLDRLYQLLPLVYRQRDYAAGHPLRALLQVIGEQAQVVGEDIAQLYENWFIETCEGWVVPYLGDLVGYRPVFEGEGPNPVNPDQQKILIPRRGVADTILFRRRKGTLALLEELTFSTAGWPARVVEFYKLLAQTQSIQRLRPERGRTVDLRNGQALRDLATPFEQIAHTIDVRRINPQAGFQRGFFNLLNVGVFVWRMKSFSVTAAPAFCWDRRAFRYTFSSLGNDSQLYVKPRREESPASIAGLHNLPVPIQREDFAARMADYYGPNKSLQIFQGFKCKEQPEQICQTPVPIDRVVAADLSDWDHYQPHWHQVLVDPETGRLIAGAGLAEHGIWVTYQYGFLAELGGGEYERPLSGQAMYRISKYEVICRLGQPDEETFSLGLNDRPIGIVLDRLKSDTSAKIIIEIMDNEAYSEPINFELRAGQQITLRAANGKQPIIRLLDYKLNALDSFSVKGGAGSRFGLDGLLIEGRSVSVGGDLAALTIRHCTLVPGWSLEPDCYPTDPNEMSLTLAPKSAMTVTIERSIIGSIQVAQNEVWTDPSRIVISDSILDATTPELEALSAGECRHAHAMLTVKNSTVIGEIDTHAIELAENSIFIGLVRVARRQIGCMRFCYVDHTLPESRTPRRFNCQPELAMQHTQDEIAVKARVTPRFRSTTFGAATYAQLTDTTASEIMTGAEDQGEMGVYHHLYNNQRLANLAARLKEFTPADMEVGLILVT